MADTTSPYRFAEAFELAVLRHHVLEPRFWATVGRHLEPSALATPEAQLVAKAVAVIAAETGRGPGSGTLVVQRLARWREEGRITHEQVLDAGDLLDELEDWEAPPPVDGVVAELVPVLRERRNREAVRLAMKRAATRDDMAEVIQHLQATTRLGVAEATEGIRLGPEALAKVRDLRQTDRLPLGIAELDAELGGGPLVRTLTTFMGGSGDGKSMALAHATGSALLAGHNVLVATLELADTQWICRLMANLTGVPIDGIADGSLEGECAARLAELPGLGQCEVGQWTPGATQVSDLLAWADEVEQRAGWRADVLVVDYADLLGHSKSRDYEGMREVFAGLREEWSVKRNGWALTASQSRRKGKAGEKQGVEDGADSQHKVRVSDLWIVLRMNDDGTEIEWYVGKNRNGKRGSCLTLPTELECARVAPMDPDVDAEIAELF